MIRDSYSILLVDDEMLPRNLLGNGLKGIADVTVTVMPNGLSAKKYLLENVVDIIVTDIRMPFMDGLELAAFIKELSPDSPVVIISGYGEFEYAKKAIQYGVKDYLLKPVQLQNLVAVVERCKEDVRQARLKQLKKRYNEQKNLEDRLQLIVKEGSQDCDIQDLECLISGQGTVVGLKVLEDKKGKKDENGQRYKNLLEGVLQTRTIVFLGYHGGEYRYLILTPKNENHRMLKAVPEYLDRVLVNKVEWAEIATVSSVRELLDLAVAARTDESSLLIERACQFMKEHLGEAISREMVAEYVYLSSSHFGHLFKQVKGMGYNAYLTEMRVDQAKKMLQKNMLVADVAAAVGYRDAKYFSEVFYQKTGCFPSDYKHLLVNGEMSRDE